jgi:hypothetical protein
LQWIPAHCNVPVNEKADKLAKEGGKIEQTDFTLSYEEAKCTIKTITRNGSKTTRAMTNTTAIFNLPYSDSEAGTIECGTTYSTSTD